VRFKILGLLEVSDESHVLSLPRGKERALLAVLLIRANEPVSTDRLIDELWGERPPEHAAKTVQVYVSRLRKTLGAERVTTTPAGYVIHASGSEVDSREFERLAREGREAFEADDAKRAARLFSEADALWRGPALADFRFEPFAQAEIRRLEELRAGARADRIDVRLARGEADAVLAELEQLVSEQPLWERPRRQLMLALYRSGRQAEALDLYRKTRALLADELGIEPSPELQELERAILNQEAALAAPTRREPRARASRGAALLAAGGVILISAAAAAAFALDRGGSSSSRAVAAGLGEIVAVDAHSGAVEKRIPAGRTPAAISAGDGALWLVDADARTVIRLDPSSGGTETLATGATPVDVAAGGGSVWVGNARPLAGAQFIGPVLTSVARLDAPTRTLRGQVSLSHRPGDISNAAQNRLAVGRGALWVVTPDFAVLRIDARSAAPTSSTRAVHAIAVAAGGAGVWAIADDGTVARLDPRTAQVVARTRIDAPVAGIAVGKDAVWVTSFDGGLWRVPERRPASLGTVDLGRGVADVAVGANAVWVANPLAGTLTEVDPRTARVVRTIDVGGIPRSVIVDGDTVWVATAADPTESAAETHGIHAFPSSTCEPAVTGKGDADVLVVSDLPLQGGTRLQAMQMAQAIAFVLREHGLRAGRFRIAYQSCDDSLAYTGLFDEAKCAANARAYGANRDVVGVIGTLNSPCALAEVPELNQAPGGALAMVSPLNSFVGLTRSGPGIDPTLPAALYPSSRRNYVRVYPTDDLEGAALALLARDRGDRRVFVLDDGQLGYGVLMATGFETAARRLGLDVVGHLSWDARAGEYPELARRVARSHPTAVFVGGLLDTNAGAVVRDLGREVGASVDVLGPDGLTPLSILVQRAGRAAVGTHVSLAGVVTEHLPPGGKRFVRAFGRTQPGVEIEPSAVYAAQSTEVLLDAIARSDGTRASIVKQLFRTRIRNGLLGTFGFDANGDVTESPVTIVRVTSGGTSNAVGSVQGGVVERVVRPSTKLVSAAGG
jgi:branched-chain amino acid transport system substrate-binding protein